jgi:hypothetical protein
MNRPFTSAEYGPSYSVEEYRPDLLRAMRVPRRSAALRAAPCSTVASLRAAAAIARGEA